MGRKSKPIDGWVEYFTSNADAIELPGGIGCRTADGRQYDRDFLLQLIDQGSHAWNKWRDSLPRLIWLKGCRVVFGFLCKLPEVNFRRKKLRDYFFTGCDFPRANFAQATLDRCWFGDVPEGHSFEKNSILRKSSFKSTQIILPNFNRCDLSGSDFSRAFFNSGNVDGANFSGSKFNRAAIFSNFENVNLSNTDFNSAYLGGALIDTDLSSVKNLSRVIFQDHVVIDHRTLTKSGVLPEVFYRGCGFPENFVDYLHSLIGGAIKMNSCFLSHSSLDHSFVERIYRDLQEARVRCFYAPKDLKIGAITRDSIESEIQIHDRLLLVLSKNSIDSQWVEHEVEAALEIERKEKRLILFPIMIDDAVFKSSKGWVSNLRRQRNIGDFSKWEHSSQYHVALSKLLADLANNGR